MRIGAWGCRTFFILACPSVHCLVDEVVPVKVLQNIEIRPHLLDRAVILDDVPVDMLHTLTEDVSPVAVVLRRLELDVVAEPTSATFRESSLKMLLFNVIYPGPEIISMEGHIASTQPYEFAEQHQRPLVHILVDRHRRLKVADRVCYG